MSEENYEPTYVPVLHNQCNDIEQARLAAKELGDKFGACTYVSISVFDREFVINVFGGKHTGIIVPDNYQGFKVYFYEQ